MAVIAIMLLSFGILWTSCILIISCCANTIDHDTHDSVRWNTDYPRDADAWFLLIYMWASGPSRNFRGLLQSRWKHFPYIWQQWGRKGGKDMVIPGFSQKLWKYHLATKAPKGCSRERRKKNLWCCFGVLVFLHVFFKSPSRYWWGRTYVFLKL